MPHETQGYSPEHISSDLEEKNLSHIHDEVESLNLDDEQDSKVVDQLKKEAEKKGDHDLRSYLRSINKNFDSWMNDYTSEINRSEKEVNETTDRNRYAVPEDFDNLSPNEQHKYMLNMANKFMFECELTTAALQGLEDFQSQHQFQDIEINKSIDMTKLSVMRSIDNIFTQMDKAKNISDYLHASKEMNGFITNMSRYIKTLQEHIVKRVQEQEPEKKSRRSIFELKNPYESKATSMVKKATESTASYLKAAYRQENPIPAEQFLNEKREISNAVKEVYTSAKEDFDELCTDFESALEEKSKIFPFVEQAKKLIMKIYELEKRRTKQDLARYFDEANNQLEESFDPEENKLYLERFKRDAMNINNRFSDSIFESLENESLENS